MYPSTVRPCICWRIYENGTTTGKFYKCSPTFLSMILLPLVIFFTYFNQLLLNPDKTKLMIFGSRQNIARMNDDFNLSFFGKDLVPATTAKDLGVIMDPNLTFSNHFLETVFSCMSGLAQITRVKYSFDKRSLFIIINSLVFSKLFYCSCFWSNTSQIKLKMLQTVQNFACRIVSGRRKYDHVSPILKELCWLPVKENIYYRDAVMSFNCLTGCAPGLSCSKHG